jgi:hypothetical protein
MKLTKKNRQTGGAVTLSPHEADIFNRIKNIYSIPEGKERKKYTDEIDKDIKNKLFLNDKVIIPVNNSETKEETLSDLSGNSLNKNSQLLPYDYYSTNDYYTSAFKSVIKTFENIVLENDDNDNVIYVSIGKVFSKFICSKNNFNERFAKYILDINKVRVYNKLILLKKLNYTINEVINSIGKCDTGIFSRNTPACVKNFFGSLSSNISNKFKSVFGKSYDSDEGQKSEDEMCNPRTINSEKNDIASKILATNIIRSQLISFIEMYKENIVSYKEASNKKKQNPTIWIRNPAFLAATTVFVNATLALNNVSADLQANKEFIERSNDFIIQTLHHPPMASAVIASTFIGMVVPLGGLAFWGVVTVLKRVLFTNREWYNLLLNSNEINLSFIEYINYWLDKDKGKPGVIGQIGKELNESTLDIRSIQTTPDMEECSLSTGPEQYFKNFSNARNLINNYTQTSNITFKNENLCLYSVNAYNIICGSLPEEQLDEPAEPGSDTINKGDITQKEIIKAERQAKMIENENKDKENQQRVAADAEATAAIKKQFLTIKTKYNDIIGSKSTLPDDYIDTNIETIKSDIQKLQDLDITCNKIEPTKMDRKFISSLFKKIHQVETFSSDIKDAVCNKQVIMSVADVDTQPSSTTTAPTTSDRNDKYTEFINNVSKCVNNKESFGDHVNEKEKIEEFLNLPREKQVEIIKNNKIRGRSTNVLDPNYKLKCEHLYRTYTDMITGGKKSRKRKSRKRKTQNKRSKKRKTIRRR